LLLNVVMVDNALTITETVVRALMSHFIWSLLQEGSCWMETPLEVGSPNHLIDLGQGAGNLRFA
jgi:hypothetical protein